MGNLSFILSEVSSFSKKKKSFIRKNTINFNTVAIEKVMVYINFGQYITAKREYKGEFNPLNNNQKIYMIAEKNSQIISMKYSNFIAINKPTIVIIDNLLIGS